MRRARSFDAFGVSYRTTELSAIDSFTLFLSEGAEPLPLDVLKYVSARAPSGDWVALDTREAVNLYVRDRIGWLAAHVILLRLMKMIRDYNIGFLLDGTWTPQKVPPRLRSGAEVAPLPNIDPIIGTIVANHLASLRELEEYYSLKDAFDLFDIYANDVLNKALSAEASFEEAKAKARH